MIHVDNVCGEMGEWWVVGGGKRRGLKRDVNKGNGGVDGIGADLCVLESFLSRAREVAAGGVVESNWGRAKKKRENGSERKYL